MESIVLAMRGRATNAKKHEERLKLKCTMLEKSLEVVSSKSPTVIRVQQSAERTREELRLMEECKKKVRGRRKGGRTMEEGRENNRGREIDNGRRGKKQWRTMEEGR